MYKNLPYFIFDTFLGFIVEIKKGTKWRTFTSPRWDLMNFDAVALYKELSSK